MESKKRKVLGKAWIGGTLKSIIVHVDNLTCSYMALNCSLNSSKLTCLDHKATMIIDDDESDGN